MGMIDAGLSVTPDGESSPITRAPLLLASGVLVSTGGFFIFLGPREPITSLLFGLIGLLVLFAYTVKGTQVGGIVFLSCFSLSIIAVLTLTVIPSVPHEESSRALCAAGSFLAVLLGGGLSALIVVVRLEERRKWQNVNNETVARCAHVQEDADKVKEESRRAAQDVVHIAETTTASLHKLEGLVSGTTDGIEFLDNAFRDTVAFTDLVVESHGKVRQVVADYSEEVQAESTAIEAMVASIDTLVESSRKKREQVASLTQLSKGAEQKLMQIRSAVDRIVSSSGKMSEISALITEVADRTNLLAMNASIEAAHAGLAGKGFAVIAGQVRLLAQESADGSCEISSILGETRDAIDETTHSADEAIRFFGNVTVEILDTVDMLEDLLAGMQEVARRSSGLMDSVDRIAKLNEMTKSAVMTSDGRISSSKASIDTVTSLAATIHKDAASMMDAFIELRGIIREIKGLSSD